MFTIKNSGMENIYRLFIVFQVLLLASFAVSASDQEDIVAQLRWLDDANAADMFANDVQSGTLRFYAVYDYAAHIPGIRDLNYRKCYEKYVPVDLIKGTSDSCINLEHYYLNQKATIFSKEYNALMRQYLQEHNLSDCSAGCDWHAAYFQLGQFLREHTPDGHRFLYDPVDYAVNGHSFEIRVNDATLIDAIQPKACQLFALCTDQKSVSFRIIRNDDVRREDAPILSEFNCFQGNVFDNDALPGE